MTYGNVYLLHFSSPIGGKRHYVGFTQKSVCKRVAEHLGGDPTSALLARAARERKIDLVLGNAWANQTPDFEKKLKREKNLPRHCSACASAKLAASPAASGKGAAGLASEGAALVPPKAG